MGLPTPLLRRIGIIIELKRNGAFSPDTAKTLEEVGIINPNWFPKVTEKLIKDKIIVKTENNKYYLNNKTPIVIR